MRLDRWFKSHYADSAAQPAREAAPHRAGARRWRPRQGEHAACRRPDRARAAAAGHGACAAPAPKALSKAERAFLASITLYEDDDLLVLNKPPGIAVQGGTKTTHHLDRLLEGLGDGPETRSAPGAPARPRHLRRARGRQAPRGGGEARPRLPDPLGAQDLLGAGARACRSRRKARSTRRWSRRPARKAIACAKRGPASRTWRSRR